jgi:hypothetical protein
VSNTREGAKEISELLRQLGREALVREAESGGLSPKGNRLRCPFDGCADKGKDRERDAVFFAGAHPRIACYSCEGRGDLVDLLQLTRRFSRAEAIRHLAGEQLPTRPAPLQLVKPAPPPEDDKLPPLEVRRLWDAMATEDELGRKYLEGRGLDGALEAGLVRFATEQHPNAKVKSQARRGYRIAVLLTDVVGNPRGIQLRMVREPKAKEPKILSITGSVTSRAFFGDAGAIESAPVIAVAEGMADTLAIGAWAGPRAVTVGAAGKLFLPKLAEELTAANVPVEGKLFALFPQNDRPKNHSRREFVRLGQLLTERGAHVVLVGTHPEFKDMADVLQAQPELPWPPPELAKAFAPEPDSTEPAALVLPPGSAVAIPTRISTEHFAQDFTTLCSLLDDPVHREAIMGRGELTFCEMTHMVRMGGRLVEEHDLPVIRLGLESQGRSTDGKPLKFGLDDIGQALKLIARRRTVHPVRDWLGSLKWDGEARLQLELPAALGHGEESLAGTLLTKWMISAVARAMAPGCKVDTVLILVGAQGVGKSSFFSVLADSWFTDSPVHVGDKDGKMIMRRNWIVEWAELDAMRRASSQEATKAFLSARVDQFREPYGRGIVEAPRGCVITGTSNNREILHDPTGNRRFWPIDVLRLELGWVRNNREQLFAEALERYRAGEQWWLTPDEEGALSESHEEHRATDAWKDLVQDYLEKKVGLFSEEVTTAQVLAEAVAKPAWQWSRADETRVGGLIQECGWRRARRSSGGKIRWVYVREQA